MNLALHTPLGRLSQLLNHLSCKECRRFIRHIGAEPKSGSSSSLRNREYIDVSEEVRSALFEAKPVVTLETAIVTHGMPNPTNIDTALRVQEIVRENGAIPATIGIVQGRIKVGLDDEALIQLGTEKSKTLKTSYRDLPFVLSQKLSGGTTVSTTLAVSKAVGVPVMVTGGIGGVHRGGETTMDISADLIELGCTPVGVVCSGVKSILDVERTLEYLETQGVMVATFGTTRDFPAFYSRESGHLSPYNVKTTEEAAGLIHVVKTGGLRSGLVIAVPVPQDSAIPGDEMEEIIKIAVREASEKGIRGKEVTPYVLSRLVKSTGGRSLKTNVALIQNNASVGAKIAVDLAKLSHERSFLNTIRSQYGSESQKPDVMVIGGAVVDNITKLSEPYKF